MIRQLDIFSGILLATIVLFYSLEYNWISFILLFIFFIVRIIYYFKCKALIELTAEVKEIVEPILDNLKDSVIYRAQIEYEINGTKFNRIVDSNFKFKTKSIPIYLDPNNTEIVFLNRYNFLADITIIIVMIGFYLKHVIN